MTNIESSSRDQLSTRARLVEAALMLFSRYGYAATGVKAILSAAKTPYGSLYHWFPGGKEELGIAAIEHGAEKNRKMIEAQFPAGGNIVRETASAFLIAAEMLESSDYADACPIATIALEVAQSDESMRVATAAAFESWLDVMKESFAAAGLTETSAYEAAVDVFCLLEGALMLSRTTRSAAPLRSVARTAANAVAARFAADLSKTP